MLLLRYFAYDISIYTVKFKIQRAIYKNYGGFKEKSVTF